MFYGGDSEYLFYDESGHTNTVVQSEGGEQGDPLMPGLFAVGIDRALQAAHTTFRPGEDLYAFPDDTYITCQVERAVPTFRAIRAALAAHANIDWHLGRTRVWNAAGVEPPRLLAEVPPQPGRPPVWAGDAFLPPEEQGMVVLGTPLGSDAFVEAFLQQKVAAHASLLSRIPTVPDLQSAWLLLLLCAAPRCHYLLRALPPSATAAFARRHDEAVLNCLRDLLANDVRPDVDVFATRRTQLPLDFGGLGLRSAEATRVDCVAAHWASWADTLPTLWDRHPGLVAGTLHQTGLQRQGEGCILPCVGAALQSESCLRQAGFDAPPWQQMAANSRPGEVAVRNFGDPLRGWQRAATACLDAAACESLLSELDMASHALLLSQAGPGGSRAITALPTSPELRLPSECMRVLSLRRLRMPLPHAPRRCRCGGMLDVFGDHRAACPVAGVLGPRGAPLERAAARVCREGGARVATNVFLRDMNIDVPLADSRRIKVLANGLPLWQGVQAAVDTTFVSPASRDGSARVGADRVPGKAAADAGRRKRQTTYPELVAARRCRLVVLAWRWEAASVLRWRISSAAWQPSSTSSAPGCNEASGLPPVGRHHGRGRPPSPSLFLVGVAASNGG